MNINHYQPSNADKVPVCHSQMTGSLNTLSFKKSPEINNECNPATALKY
jgi:hypothetical protein